MCTYKNEILNIQLASQWRHHCTAHNGKGSGPANVTYWSNWGRHLPSSESIYGTKDESKKTKILENCYYYIIVANSKREIEEYVSLSFSYCKLGDLPNFSML